ncbi:MAG TPA: nitroreductase family protein [Acidimicrobiales bacterium]|nr:nitroreductase family protein [Acidimicrobiales bacterium]
MELGEVVRRRKMVRSFSGEPVPAPFLDRVLNLACRAPSAGNTGGWDAVVLVGPDETAPFWDATTTADWRARSRRWPGLARAPVVVALFVDPDAYRARYAEPDKHSPTSAARPIEGEWPVPYWFVDGGFALMTMLLAAVDAGLGACFLGNFRGEDALRVALGVPEDRRYVGAVLVGAPGGGDPPSSSLARGSRNVSEAVHRGRW